MFTSVSDAMNIFVRVVSGKNVNPSSNALNVKSEKLDESSKQEHKMDSLVDIEAKLRKVQVLRAMEHAFLLLEGGPKHNALVSAIVAEDAAESERSVRFTFDAVESKAIFEAAAAALKKRFETIKAELGA